MSINIQEKKSSALLLPRLLTQKDASTNGLECSLHTLPKPLEREFLHVFGDAYLKRPSNAAAISDDSSQKSLQRLSIPTNQKAREDLVAVGDHIEKEKDRLLNVFIEFGREICERIIAHGYWADFIDPCSGLPMLSQSCNKVYSEVDGMECLLNYRAYNAGFCKVLTHPKWGSAVYPATIFLHCPIDIAKDVLQSYPHLKEDEMTI